MRVRHLPSCLALLAALTGCAGGGGWPKGQSSDDPRREDFSLYADATLTPTFRATWYPLHEPVDPWGEPPPVYRAADWTLAVDLESALTFREGTYSTLEPDSFLSWRDASLVNPLPSPVRVRTDAYLLGSSLVGRVGGEFFQMLRTEVTLGWRLDYVHLDLRSDQGDRARFDRVNGGPQLGARLSLRPVDCLELYGSASFAILLDTWNSYTSQAEAGVVFRPVQHLGLFGGYRSMSWKQAGGSDVRLDLGGPVVGVLVEF